MSLKAFYYKYILYKNITIINIALSIFWILGLILLTYLCLNIFFYDKNIQNQNFISALGIVISAFIASLSVMKSIYENKELERKKFLLQQLTICHEIASIELNKFRIELSSFCHSGFINTDDGKQTKLGNLVESAFDNFKSNDKIIKLLWTLRCYFPHLVNDFTNMIEDLENSTGNEIHEYITNFLNILELEQLQYILNRNKIKFKIK